MARQQQLTSRRSVLAQALAGATVLAAHPVAAAVPPADDRAGQPSGALRFYHIHTDEKLNVEYRQGNAIISSALGDIDHLLRDFRSGQETQMDIGLLDTLSLIYDRFDRTGWFEIISGYRSPRTNKALRRVTTGVAEHSYHMQGQAIDVRLVGIRTDRFRDAALALGRGGVGYYPESNFVHIDSGYVRSW
jgi:uncharacterized protein YcbK (DUF882 family)